MGSLGDGDAQNGPIKTNPNVDFSFTQTQAFDSQLSPSQSPCEQAEDATELQFEYTAIADDAYETQVLNLAGETQALNFGDEPQALKFGSETQAMDFVDEPQASNFGCETQALDFGDEPQALYIGGETQALNFGGETQVLDYLDGIENADTQLLNVFDDEVADDSDSEASHRTEVLGDGDDISGDGSARRGSGQLSLKDKMHCTSASEEGNQVLREGPEALNGEHCDSGVHVPTTPVVQGTPEPKPGSVPRFTSIRSASLRASGLAGHSIALMEANSDSCSVLNNGLFSDEDGIRSNWLEPKVMKEDDQVHDLEKNNGKEQGLRNGNKCRIGSSTVRKLFIEDSLSEDEGLNGENTDGGENLRQIPVCDPELAGLSYIDSQEPGELSQANALKFVEMFIEKNISVEFDHAVGHGNSTDGKSKPVSTTRGPQNLAKKANVRSTVGLTGVFNWDDNLEDEGGGDIFCRKKEEFFGSRSHVLRSLSEPQKPKQKKIDVCREEEQLDVHDKIMVQSDSRVMLHNKKKNKRKAQDSEMKFKRNLVTEMDEQFNTDSLRGQVEDIVSKMDVPEMLIVGPDTQMAAEAMEALLCSEGIPNHDVDGPQSNSNVSAEGSLRGKSKNRVRSRRPSSRKSVCLSDIGVATRQSKRLKRTGDLRLSEHSTVSSLKHSKTTRKEPELEPVTRKRKRTKSTAEEHFTTNGIKNVEANSPRVKCKSSDTACTSPANCMTLVNAVSPVCMGDEYLKQSCKKNLSRSCLTREIKNLTATEPEPISPLKELRKRRDMTSIHVLFSQHLDEDIVKHQKKILARLGASVAISISDATHFITDSFVRTRNMLEAIASGKPVVTHLWLESIGQVKVHIDEEAYLLRDTKKEKEFGFSMPVSLARARKHPLLHGRRVLITQNIKPGKETISSLVKAVHGKAVERIGRSAIKDDKITDDLLILSCEEDYGICEPFLEKGLAVYSSELLLNGIVTQKMEYERHRLFADNVKRTRSTIWLKKDGDRFHPVTKLK